MVGKDVISVFLNLLRLALWPKQAWTESRLNNVDIQYTVLFTKIGIFKLGYSDAAFFSVTITFLLVL